MESHFRSTSNRCSNSPPRFSILWDFLVLSSFDWRYCFNLYAVRNSTGISHLEEKWTKLGTWYSKNWNHWDMSEYRDAILSHDFQRLMYNSTGLATPQSIVNINYAQREPTQPSCTSGRYTVMVASRRNLSQARLECRLSRSKLSLVWNCLALSFCHDSR